jgi:Fic family protein
MERFVDWLNSDESRDLHPVVVAGIAHYELVRIHPFVDGNDRVARALATHILTIRGFDIKRFFTLDDFYDSDRHAYYTVLDDVNKTYPDCTIWLDYFTEGVKISLQKVKERVLLLSGDQHRKATSGQVALSERHMKIIEYVRQNGSVKTRDIVGLFHISRQVALKELKVLIDQDLLLKEGIRKSAHYILK